MCVFSQENLIGWCSIPEAANKDLRVAVFIFIIFFLLGFFFISSLQQFSGSK